MAGSPLRTVGEPLDFQELRDKYVGVRMFDEIMRGVAGEVARDPARFAVPGTNRLGVIITNAFQGQPSFRIVFTYDHERVHLRWIEPTEADSQ